MAWINVKDRMPPACHDVIVFGRPWRDRARRQRRVYVTYISTRPRECVEDEEITHWQMMPPRPEDSTND